MDHGIVVGKVAEWSEDKISDEALIEAVEAARPSLEEHRAGFDLVVADFNQEQKAHCSELLSMCYEMFELMEEACDLIVKYVQEEDRNQVFIAGDTVARASYQLNQAFSELNNQALLALGPTEIPNFNLIIKRKEEYLAAPSDETRLLLSEALDGERVFVYHTLEDLAKEERLPEVETLINAFRDHMACLNDLAENLEHSGNPLTDAEETAVLLKMIKQRREAAEGFRKGGAEDRAANEDWEAEALESYLPPAPTEEEIEKAVDEEVAKIPEDQRSPKSMGVVMKALNQKFAGRPIDGKALSQKVRQKLL